MSTLVCVSREYQSTDPLRHEPLHKRLFSRQLHLGRCGGDGRRNQVHDVVKFVVKRLVLCNPDPGGIAIPPNQLILEAKHLRSDPSRPGDPFAISGGIHAKDATMDVVLISTLSKSCLLQTCTSSDFALRQANGKKFRKDLKNREPLQLFATQRFILVDMNHCGSRGPHLFDAILREMASLMIWRPT